MNYKKILCLFIFSVFIICQSKAQGLYGAISDFSINSSYLTPSGKIKLSNTGTTVVKYTVTISRSIDPGNQSPNPKDFNWYSTNIGIGLGRYSGGKNVWFSGSATITNADFKPYQSVLVKEFTATINNSELITGNKIFLVYELHNPGVPSSIWFKEKYMPGEYDFEYPVTIFYNDEAWAIFSKNNCSSSSFTIPYLYSVSANKYSSTISKADANSKATSEIAQNGQTTANNSNVCYFEMPTPRETTRLHLGYIEDIDWDPSLSPGNQTVKIELLIRKGSFDYTPGPQYILFKVLYEAAPNTGKVIGGINSSTTNFPNIGDYKLKITANNGNIYYLSDIFSLEADRD